MDPTHRRRFIKLAGGAVGLGAVATASRIALHPDDSSDPSRRTSGRLSLSADDGSDVAALELPLGDQLLPRTGSHRWGSTELATSTHSMVAFTWHQRSRVPHIRINSRTGKTWTGWQDMQTLHDLPDRGTEGRGMAGTDLLWVGAADGIQIEVDGHRPPDLTMVLLHPARRASDTATRRRTGILARTSAKPTLFSRKDWGADESWRSGSPRYCSTIQQAHIHHTVNSNDYAIEDVPALIRGMYRYHTHSLGWSDIAYNFLVDRFGQGWVGRAGGAGKAVRGAHTLGFNATSTGISHIGNFDLVYPTPEMLSMTSQIAAWKLSKYGAVATGTTQVVSEGSDKFRAGEVVTLPVMDGHRDTNDTACPGQHLYDAIPQLRISTQAIIDAAQMQPVAVVTPPTLSGVPALGQTLTVTPGTYNPAPATLTYTWSRNGVVVPDVTGTTYTCGPDDVGTQVTVHVDAATPGYIDARQDLTAAGPVKVPSAITMRIRGRHLKAQIKVTVTAVGMPTIPTGVVKIKVRNRTKKVTLVNGKGKASFVGFTTGKYKVLAGYHGDATMLPLKVTDTVHVR